MWVGTLAALALTPLSAAFGNRAELVAGIYGLVLLACSLYLFCVGSAYRWLVNATSVNRTFLQIIPVILFAVVVMTTLRCAARREAG